MMTMNKCVSLILGVGLLAMSACAKDEAATTEAKSTAKVVQALPKLVDLGAKKCIPCKKMAPILEELTAEYKGVFDVVFIDVWQPENKTEAQKYGIQSIPTQIFFDASGKELGRHEGFISKEDILKKWQAFGVNIKHTTNKGRNE